MSYEYGPLPAPHYIRLLQITRTSSDVTQASVKIINLDDNVQYRCLSYTWDGGKFDDVGEKWSTPNKAVLLDGQAFLIRQNLHDALDHLRLLEIDGPIWIDAICINQADIAERNSQVSQMSRIYENAQQVVVWLGKEEAYSASAIKSMQRLKFTMEDMFIDTQSSQSTTSPPWERDFIDCRFTDKELVEMIDFFVTYRWFSRIWTVQELILARKLMFVCGTIIEPLDTIWRGSFMSNFLGFASSWDRLRSTRELQWARDFGVVSVLEYIRRRLNETPSSIGVRANDFRNRQATDPRDKVFGIASISRTVLPSCVTHTRELTRV
jgi:Heterokaryon incompatibility protein (HET)